MGRGTLTHRGRARASKRASERSRYIRERNSLKVAKQQQAAFDKTCKMYEMYVLPC